MDTVTINHDITYRAGYYAKDGRFTYRTENCTSETRYEHKTRKSLLEHAENAAFWDAYHKGISFKRLLVVDGNAA